MVSGIAMKVAQVWLLCCSIRAVHSAGEATDIDVVNGELMDLAGYREGNSLTLRCEVTGLGSSSQDYVVSWQHGEEVISMDAVLKAPYEGSRFAVMIDPLPGRGDTSDDLAYDLTISPVQRGDAGDYSCLIKTQVQGNPMSFTIVAVQSVSLSVLYFPNHTSPTCQPGGPMDVKAGEPVLLKCSSEKGNPEVTLTLSNIGTNSWSTIQDRDTISQELLINVVTPSNDGLVFICTIESPAFPDLDRSCQLGPLNVLPSVVNPTDGVASPAENDPIFPGSGPSLSPPSNGTCRSWLIAFLAASGLATVCMVIIIALVTSRRMQEDKEKMKRRKVKGLNLDGPSHKEAKVTDAEQGAYTNVAVTSD